MIPRLLYLLFYVASIAFGQVVVDVAPGEANLRAAQAKVRSMLPGMTSDIHVRLHGRYDLKSPFVFDENDAGRGGWRVYWESAPGEVATISGGAQVTGWEQDGKLWKAKLGVSSMRQFFVNGKRMMRARFPNLTDTIDNGPYLRLSSWDVGRASIVLNSIDVPEGAFDVGTEIVVHKHWNMGMLRVEGMGDSAGGKTQVIFKHPDVDLNSFEFPQKHADQVFRWENSKRFLDVPGEWYFNKVDSVLSYWPMPGDVLSSVDARVPVVENIVKFIRAKSITLDRLNLEYTSWDRIDCTGYGDDQGSIWVAGASMDTPVNDSLKRYLLIRGVVEIDSSEQIRIRKCRIRHAGGQGVVFQGTTRGNRIFGSRIEDVAANGIAFRQNYLQTAGGSSHDTVDQNVLTRIGQFFSGSAAINAMYPEAILVAHNRIMETPYSGVSLGWAWDGTSTSAKGNNAQFNDISRTNRLHDDGGGIYTLGKQPSSSVSDNWIHEITRGPWLGAWPLGALYFDQGTEGIEAARNSFYGVDGTVSNLELLHLGVGVSAPNLYQSNLSEASSDLKNTRSLSGPLAEIFWEGNVADSGGIFLRVPDSLNLALGKTPSVVGENWQFDLGRAYEIQQIALAYADTAMISFSQASSYVIQGARTASFDSASDLGVWSIAKKGLITDWWIGPEVKAPVRYIRIRFDSSLLNMQAKLQVRGIADSGNSISIGMRRLCEKRVKLSVQFDRESGKLRIIYANSGAAGISISGRRN